MDEKADELNEKCKEILAKGIPQLPMPEGMPLVYIKITDESFMPEVDFSDSDAVAEIEKKIKKQKKSLPDS